MAKAGYVGINGVARKLKKMYVGINGVARKLKKLYVGINGVARLWWSGESKYFGNRIWAGNMNRTPIYIYDENLTIMSELGRVTMSLSQNGMTFCGDELYARGYVKYSNQSHFYKFDPENLTILRDTPWTEYPNSESSGITELCGTDSKNIIYTGSGISSVPMAKRYLDSLQIINTYGDYRHEPQTGLTGRIVDCYEFDDEDRSYYFYELDENSYTQLRKLTDRSVYYTRCFTFNRKNNAYYSSWVPGQSSQEGFCKIDGNNLTLLAGGRYQSSIPMTTVRTLIGTPQI